MKDVITKLIDKGERVYVPSDFINVLGENEPKERGMDNGDTCIRDERLDTVWDIYSNFGILEPKDGYGYIKAPNINALEEKLAAWNYPIKNQSKEVQNTFKKTFNDLNMIFDDKLTWEELFLSLRFEANRTPDKYNEFLIVFLKFADPLYFSYYEKHSK